MTCEIAIMNKQAAVLAADSATTVTQWVNGSKEERYFKGTNKIFQISNYQPVGMMIYAASNLQGVPWEIVAKDFREHLDQKTFKDLSGYAQQLFTYVQSHDQLFPKDFQRASFLEDAVKAASLHLYLKLLVDESVKSADSEQSRTTAIHELMANNLAEVENEELPTHFEQRDLDEALASYAKELAEKLRKQYENDSNTNGVDLDNLADLAIRLLLKRYSQYMDKTGIVVAGFGENDYFPSYREYSCYGLLLGKFLFDEESNQQVDRNSPSFIKPFATTAMVNTFVVGFSPDVFGLVKEETRKSVKAFAESVSADHGVDFGSALDSSVENVVEQHTNAWVNSAFSNHAWPLLRVIGSLPVDEMAELAETLIMLESLKEKVTQPTESVGGPIDVCVISKTEGFIWIKRKHYFDPKLNPHFFRRQAEKFNSHIEEQSGAPER